MTDHELSSGLHIELTVEGQFCLRSRVFRNSQDRVHAMPFSWRALCLFHVLSSILLIPFCNTATAMSWQDRDLITTRLEQQFKAPKVRHWKRSHHRKRDDAWANDPVAEAPSPAPSPFPEACTVTDVGCIFSVMTFDAVGDGITDDTKAFQATWKAACLSESSVLLVPAYYVFVVGQITFKGHCKRNITFQVDGTIIPPTDLSVWDRLTNKGQWIGFYKQFDITLLGSGIVNGLGEVWWRQPCKLAAHGRQRCPSPTTVKFYGCNNVVVRDITIQDSPQMHLKFDNCQQVQVLNVSILSPAWSPNTDGIHLQNTGYALLENLVIAAGDDCISLQTGTTDVIIRNVVCGPGHGISIGGLGQGNSQACVSNITVQDVLIQDTQNGVRIKTWQGGTGVVQHVIFDTVAMINVRNPIVINQFYCDAADCQNDTSAVLVRDVVFRNIQGTYDQLRSHAPIYFACSDTVPCRGIQVDNVELLPSLPSLVVPSPSSFCWNSYGAAGSFCFPRVCLIDIPFAEEAEEYYC